VQVDSYSQWSTVDVDCSNFRSAILDRSLERCIAGLFFGKVEASLRKCEHLIVGPMFEPKRVRIGRNPQVWLLYTAYEALAYETKSIFGISGYKI
jgi:hypothetical protein